MSQEVVVPDWAKAGPAQAFAVLNARAQEDNLSAGIGQSYAVLGYRGKQWSLRYRGERKNFVRPDDGTPASFLDVIILGQAREKSKSFYQNYVEGDTSPPTCASIDGMVPDSDVRVKQSASCALCPRNVWKTDPTTGRKGRECTDYKRLAVLVLPAQTKLILGEPLLEPVFLRVPPASLTSLAAMGETMGKQGFHYTTYVTRITFDPNKSHPEMVFRPIQGLSNAEAPAILQFIENPLVGRITGADLALQGMLAVDQVTQVPVVGLAAPATPPPAITSAPTQHPQTTPATALAAAPIVMVQPAQSSIVAVTQSSPPLTGPPLTGLEGLGVALPATPPPPSSAGVLTLVGAPQSEPATGGASTVLGTAPTPATVADAGVAEDSDAALDARIASLMSRP